ncbi:MAG: phosphoglucosamine mutase [Lachnospiraceae bacterium]|jgi:phosphoglucosamine mutase|nr:phosphoglucosamine mutase [Lachnospiraceae bacterium]
MGKYFGTDGFRGEANRVLTAQHAFRIGRFLGNCFSTEDRPAKILIGKDTRRSSYMFEYALAAGITASGGDVYLLHVTTTPSVSYVVRSEDFDCGIMISASHNPFDDNGIKLIGGNGEKISGGMIEQLEQYLDAAEDSLPLATGVRIGRTVDYVVGRNRYIGYLISIAAHSFKDLKIGLDVANGSAWEMARAIFNALGARTFVIHNEPDGFNINRGCGATHIASLQALVKEKQLDMGFAFDGDGDRCIAVDEQGEVVNGDRILYILARYMKEQGMLPKNMVAATQMSNMGLAKSLEPYGIAVSETEVGDRFVYTRMVENGYTLGGEKTGHIILFKYATTGDGILTAIKLTEVMLERKKKFSELLEGYSEFPQLQINVRVYDKDRVIADPDVQAAAGAEADALGGRGRVILRRSGTEPVVRVLVEAPEMDICRAASGRITDAIDRKGYVDSGKEASSDGVF